MHQVPFTAVSEDWAEKALIDAEGYARRNTAASVEDPENFWRGEAQRIDWIKPFTTVKNTSFDKDTLRHPAGSRTARSTSRPIASTGTSPTRATYRRDHVGAGRSRMPGRSLTYRELYEAACRFANVLQGQRREEGRPGHDLPADDPRGRSGDARLRADRRGPFDRVRRASAPRRSAGGSTIATAGIVITSDEGLRGGKSGPAQGQRRRGRARHVAESSA